MGCLDDESLLGLWLNTRSAGVRSRTAGIPYTKPTAKFEDAGGWPNSLPFKIKPGLLLPVRSSVRLSVDM